MRNRQTAFPKGEWRFALNALYRHLKICTFRTTVHQKKMATANNSICCNLCSSHSATELDVLQKVLKGTKRLSGRCSCASCTWYVPSTMSDHFGLNSLRGEKNEYVCSFFVTITGASSRTFSSATPRCLSLRAEVHGGIPRRSD